MIAALFISYDEDHNLPDLAGDLLMQTQHCAGVAFIDMIVNCFFSYIFFDLAFLHYVVAAARELFYGA